jgi:hypothetical protein
MSFIKGLVPGALLTWVVCMVIGSNRSKGGFLQIHPVDIQGLDFYWSWPLFVAATGLAWAIFWMME